MGACCQSTNFLSTNFLNVTWAIFLPAVSRLDADAVPLHSGLEPHAIHSNIMPMMYLLPAAGGTAYLHLPRSRQALPWCGGCSLVLCSSQQRPKQKCLLPALALMHSDLQAADELPGSRVKLIQWTLLGDMTDLGSENEACFRCMAQHGEVIFCCIFHRG